MKGDNLTLTESTDKLEIQGDNLSVCIKLWWLWLKRK
jgi:hypothetical protein